MSQLEQPIYPIHFGLIDCENCDGSMTKDLDKFCHGCGTQNPHFNEALYVSIFHALPELNPLCENNHEKLKALPGSKQLEKLHCPNCGKDIFKR
jgi:hypothetical protein